MKNYMELDAWMIYPTQYVELITKKELPPKATGKEIVKNLDETNSVQSCLARSEI